MFYTQPWNRLPSGLMCLSPGKVSMRSDYKVLNIPSPYLLSSQGIWCFMSLVNWQSPVFPVNDCMSVWCWDYILNWERGGSVVQCRTPEREVRGSRPTAAVLCPWARHFTPRKYWLITQEAMAPSRHDWKIVDWDVKPQHNQHTKLQI